MTDNSKGIRLGLMTMIPGVVQDNKDPEKLQRVKAVIPGVFDNSTMDVEAMPWIYPLIHVGYQSYNTMLPGTKIWVLIDPTNYYGYFYLPFFQMNDNTKELIKGEGETDVVLSRQLGDQSVSIHYNTEDGVMLDIGESKVQICTNGDINVFSNGVSFKVVGGVCYCGTDGGKYDQMVMGNRLVAKLCQLASDFSTMAAVAAGNPYTMKLGDEFTKTSMHLNNDIDDLVSKSSFVAE